MKNEQGRIIQQLEDENSKMKKLIEELDYWFDLVKKENDSNTKDDVVRIGQHLIEKWKKGEIWGRVIINIK